MPYDHIVTASGIVCHRFGLVGLCYFLTIRHIDAQLFLGLHNAFVARLGP